MKGVGMASVLLLGSDDTVLGAICLGQSCWKSSRWQAWHIFVYEDEYDNALRLLERNQMIPEQLRYCPHCGSDEIKFVLKKSHRVRAVVAAVIAALSAAPPGTEHWEYVCRKCGTHFEKPVAKGTVEE